MDRWDAYQAVEGAVELLCQWVGHQGGYRFRTNRVGYLRNARLLTGLGTRHLHTAARGAEDFRKQAFERLYRLIKLRESVEENTELRVSQALSISFSRALTALILSGLRDLDRRAIPHILRFTHVSLEEGGSVNYITWVDLSHDSLVMPVRILVELSIKYLRIVEWGDAEGYRRGLDRLKKLLLMALETDCRVCKCLSLERAGRWHYNNVVKELRRERREPLWAMMTDIYTPYALLLFAAFENTINESGEVIRLDPDRLRGLVKGLGAGLEPFHQSLAPPYEELQALLDEPVPKRVVKRVMGRLQALWGGWLNSTHYLDDLVARRDGERLLLAGRPEVMSDLAGLSISLGGLAASRQVIHLYSHTAEALRLQAEELGARGVKDRVGDPEEVAEALMCLHPKAWPKNHERLQKEVMGSLPSIYDQMFHTHTVLIGMLYAALSDMSMLFGLDPEIPPDPKAFLEERGVPVGEGHRLSVSVERLRRAASLPVGYTEEVPLRIWDLLMARDIVAGM